MHYRYFPTLLVLLALVAPLSGNDRKAASISDGDRRHCLEVLRAGLHSEDFWPSIHAAEGLTLGGHGREVVEFLAPKLPKEKDDQRRCGIARELVRAGKRSNAKVMLAILDKQSDYGHTHAAESLYKVDEIGNGVALKRIFGSTKDLRLKLMAAAALGRKGDATAMTFIRTTTSHEDPELYRVAAWILGRIGNENDVPLLKKQLSRCPDELTRAYFEHSLAALGDEEGLAALGRNLRSDDGVVRTYAATFAGDARAVQFADTLKAMLDDPHEDARIRAAQSLLVLSAPNKDK